MRSVHRDYLVSLGGVVLQVPVRVVDQRQSTVGLLDLVAGGPLRESEHLVQVLGLRSTEKHG